MGMNSDGSESSVHEIREISLRGFETWLDSALAGEQPPPGLAADLLTAIENGEPLAPVEGRCDLYALWSAITALTQEVKLQSRTFKEVGDTFAQLHEAVAAAMVRGSGAELMEVEERVVGEEFDSHRMTAVEREETDSVPEGTVVGVYRNGYEWEGEVYRLAQVKVARRKSSDREID